MIIRLITPGKIKHSFFAEAEKEYIARIKRFCDFEVTEAKEEKLTAKTDPNVAKRQEGLRLLEKIDPAAAVVALDERGKNHTAAEFANLLMRLETAGKPVVIVIGGANGLDESILEKADHRLSLGKMTLTQDLARTVFLEALFRGFCINRNLPFHR